MHVLEKDEWRVLISEDPNATVLCLSERAQRLSERIRKVLDEHLIHFDQNGYF